MPTRHSSRLPRAVERCVACGSAVVSLGGGLWQAFEANSAEFLCRGRAITCPRCQGDSDYYCGVCASTGHILGGHEPAPTTFGGREPGVRERHPVTPRPPRPASGARPRADSAARAGDTRVAAGLSPTFGFQTGATTFGIPPSASASGTAVVTAVGDIDFHTAPALSRRLHQAIENSAAVVLDLTAVTLFSRAGLPILVCAADHADTLAVAFAVVCHEPSAVCFGLRTPVIIASSAPVGTDASGHHEKKKPS